MLSQGALFLYYPQINHNKYTHTDPQSTFNRAAEVFLCQKIIVDYS